MKADGSLMLTIGQAPAHQGLGADYESGAIDLGLEEGLKPLFVYGQAQVGLHALALEQLAVQSGIEQPVSSRPASLAM